MNKELAVEVSGLVKVYHDGDHPVPVLSDVTFSVARGEPDEPRIATVSPRARASRPCCTPWAGSTRSIRERFAWRARASRGFP